MFPLASPAPPARHVSLLVRAPAGSAPPWHRRRSLSSSLPLRVSYYYAALSRPARATLTMRARLGAGGTHPLGLLRPSARPALPLSAVRLVVELSLIRQGWLAAPVRSTLATVSPLGGLRIARLATPATLSACARRPPRRARILLLTLVPARRRSRSRSTDAPASTSSPAARGSRNPPSTPRLA